MGFSGGKQLKLDLDVISRLYTRKFLLLTLKEHAKPMSKAARKAAPKLTGLLAKGVKPRARGARYSRKGTVMVKVGPSKKEFWGMFQEFGTRHHKAQPWMRPSWDSTKHVMLADITKSFATVLNRTARRIERKALRNKRLTKSDVNLLFGD